VGFIVLKSNAKKDVQVVYKELIQMVRDKLGAVATFRKVGLVPSLPKTRSGKVLRVQ